MVSTQRWVSGGLCSEDVGSSFGMGRAVTVSAGAGVPFGIGVDGSEEGLYPFV